MGLIMRVMAWDISQRTDAGGSLVATSPWLAKRSAMVSSPSAL
jgi:hypothetical protein